LVERPVPYDDHISVSKKQVVATYINSGAVILASLVSFASGVLGGWQLQRISPAWQGEEQSLTEKINAQQKRIVELTSAEAAEKQRLVGEEAKSEQIEQQLQSQIGQLRNQLADAQTALNSKDQRVPDVGDNRASLSPKIAPDHQVDVGVFRLESQDCARTGTIIRCSGTITNLGSEPEDFHWRWNESSLVDNFGGQLQLSDQIFKLGDGTRKPLQPHLPIAFVISAGDPKENTSHITLILSVAGSQFPLPMERNSAVRLEFSVPPP
jgi:hypothetical protein